MISVIKGKSKSFLHIKNFYINLVTLRNVNKGTKVRGRKTIQKKINKRNTVAETTFLFSNHFTTFGP